VTPITGPASKLVYATDARELPPRPRTHFTIRNLAAAAHVASLGAELETVSKGTYVLWRCPVRFERDAARYSDTLAAIQRGMDRVKQHVPPQGAQTRERVE
jgi:hypothetical protein